MNLIFYLMFVLEKNRINFLTSAQIHVIAGGSPLGPFVLWTWARVGKVVRIARGLTSIGPPRVALALISKKVSANFALKAIIFTLPQQHSTRDLL